MTENERQPVRAFTVDETAAGERLDKFLSTVCPDLTRSAAARVIEEGGVLLDGAPGNKKDKLRPGTRVELRLPDHAAHTAKGVTAVVQQRVHQRAGIIPRCRVHHHTLGLVHHL